MAVSGVHDEDDEDLQEFQELLESQEKGESTSNLDLMTRGKLFMHDLVQRVGFFGILAAASIPNPLFDLAGITCGHFLVPFWTFFGATLIGKAVIKMHIQKVFIIFLFSKHHVAWLLEIIKVSTTFFKDSSLCLGLMGLADSFAYVTCKLVDPCDWSIGH